MGRTSKSKSKRTAESERKGQSGSSSLWVDPCKIRFQHSKIRPYFSGCGRSVLETLESIRRNELSPSDLPPIQVIVGPETEDGSLWYFSLNNRRLWVLKRCRDEGLLENNLIEVRVRVPKSSAEVARYTVENCVLEAKIVREAGKRLDINADDKGTDAMVTLEVTGEEYMAEYPQDTVTMNTNNDSSSGSDSDNGGLTSFNPFSALSS